MPSESSLRERSEPGREEAAEGRGNFAVGQTSKEPGNISFRRSSPNADDSAVPSGAISRSAARSAERQRRGWGPGALKEGARGASRAKSEAST